MNRINLSESELAALAARIQRNYDYDPERGLLVNRKTGKTVKGIIKTGRNYRRFGFRHQGKMKFLNYHWAVWAWHHGRLPTMQIDHVNHDTFDNHIENLREVTQSENKLNSAQPWQSGSGGLPGVLCDKGSYRIRVKRKRYSSRDPFHLFYLLTLLGRRFK